MSLRDQIAESLPPFVRGALSRSRQSVLHVLRSWRSSRVIVHHGIRLVMDDSLPATVRRSLYRGEYEGGELAAVRQFLRDDDVVLELGAGIGFITLYCAARVGADRVFSFEANRRLEPLLQSNFRENRLYPHLEFAILAQDEGEVDFHLEDEYWSSSRIRRTDDALAVRVPSKSVNREIRRIDPTFLIMDIEGGEVELVPLIDFHHIQRVMIELHPYVVGEQATTKMLNHLKAEGFDVRWSCPKRLHLLLVRRTPAPTKTLHPEESAR